MMILDTVDADTSKKKLSSTSSLFCLSLIKHKNSWFFGDIETHL